MVVAGHIAPLSLVMPHHDHAVLSGEEVAVGLPWVPVLVELGQGWGGGEALLRRRTEEWAGGVGRGAGEGTPGACGVRGLLLKERSGALRGEIMGTGSETEGERPGGGKGHGKGKEREGRVPGGGGRSAWKKRPRQRDGWREPLTRGTPSDHRKSPSMVLSLRPIHWYSRYRSAEARKGDGVQ